MAKVNEPLQRDVAHKKIAGVCAGLANYLGVDVTLVRAVTAALILLGPAVVALYAILWWALDEATPASEVDDADTDFGIEGATDAEESEPAETVGPQNIDLTAAEDAPRQT